MAAALHAGRAGGAAGQGQGRAGHASGLPARAPAAIARRDARGSKDDVVVILLETEAANRQPWLTRCQLCRGRWSSSLSSCQRHAVCQCVLPETAAAIRVVSASQGLVPRPCRLSPALRTGSPPAPVQDCPLPHPNYGHVLLGKPSPVLFYPISPTEVRLATRQAAAGCWTPAPCACPVCRCARRSQPRMAPATRALESARIPRARTLRARSACLRDQCLLHRRRCAAWWTTPATSCPA